MPETPWSPASIKHVSYIFKVNPLIPYTVMDLLGPLHSNHDVELQGVIAGCCS